MYTSCIPLPEESLSCSDADLDKAYLQLLIEHSPIAIVVLNSLHHAEQCNPAFERIFGFNRSEIVNRNFDELIACGDMLDDARRYTASVLQRQKVQVVTRRRRKDGVWIDVDMIGIPLIIEGVLRGVYGLYVDISERTRAESSLRQLTRELMQSQENEKRRVARELHDATAQELALLSMRLGKLHRILAADNPEVLELVDSIRDLARECTQKIRSASYLLHPPLLQEAGLVPAISWLAQGFAERTGIPVNVQISSKFGRLSDAAELTIFRVVQESLSNVLRHSSSTAVDIRLKRKPGAIQLSVENRGSTSTSGNGNSALTHHGIGIVGMRERLKELGGHLDLRPADRGMTVFASFPTKVRASA
jgi:two-component system, NarL family, sensor kinase